MTAESLKCIACLYDEDGQLNVKEIDFDTAVGEHEVLIAVYAAGVNRADILQRQGKYRPPKGASEILGLEVAGKIIKCGSKVDDLEKNMNVIALLEGGGYASYCKTSSHAVLPLPPNWSWHQGAGFAEAFFTVWKNVMQIGQLKTHETFLTHAGASGIGMAAVQIAKNIGARVIATAGSEEKIEFCRENGADLAINYKKKDFVKEIIDFVGKNGVNVILDAVGGDYLEKNIRIAAKKSRIVYIASMQNPIAALNIFKMMQKQITITGSTLRHSPALEKQFIRNQIHKKLWSYMKNKTIITKIDAIFDLENTQKAHRKMQKNQNIGKIILDMQKYH